MVTRAAYGESPLPVAMRVEVERTMLQAMAAYLHAEPDWLVIVSMIQRYGRIAAAAHIFDIESSLKMTPLHLAARFGRADYAALFAARGGDVNAGRPDRYSQSALLCCAGAPEAADEAHDAALAATIRVLALCGADVEARSSNDASSLSALGHAVSRGSLPRTSALLAAGAQVNSRFRDGSTPLHLAARRGDEAIARLLVEYGASTDLLSSTTRTPAEEAYSEGFVELGHWLRSLHQNKKYRFVRD